MNEQIVITNGDVGIEIEVQFVDSKKKPVDITNCTVEISFMNPNGEREAVQGHIKDYINGLAGIILNESKTNSNGLWSTFWSVVDSSGFVTSQEAIYYFVVASYGG